MNELSDRFLDSGEIIYANRADSAVAHTGYGRVGIDIYITGRRIDRVRIYWNNYRDSADVEIGNRTGCFRTFVEDLDESMYIFQIVSIDDYGNKSLPVELSGETVGENFMSRLRNRAVISAFYTADNEVTVQWGNAPSYGIDCVLSYTDTSGRKVTLNVPASETTTVLSDWKSGLSYVTQFIPAEGAVDTLRLETVNQGVIVELSDKSGWSVTDCLGGYHNEDYSPAKVIDGLPRTTWHTDISKDYPYYIIIDFGFALQIDGITFQNRLDDAKADNFPKQVKWEASNDLNEWMTILSFDEMSASKDKLWLPCTKSAVARYLKFTMYSGWKGTSYGYIGEMGVFRIM
jgi:hypothetical protein